MVEPVYPLIRDKIEAGIRTGEWGERLPSVLDLAKRFGVSHLTVLKAIDQLKHEGRVVVKKRRGNFVAPEGANRGFSPFVGVVGYSDEADSAYIAEDRFELQIIKNYLEAHGFKMLSINHFNESDSHFVETLTNMRVGGYLFSNSRLTQHMADRLKLEGAPFVSLNFIDRIPGISCVDFDHENGLLCLLRHSVACGHRRIGLVVQHTPSLLTYSEGFLDVYRRYLTASDVYDSDLVHLFENRTQRDPKAREHLVENMFDRYYRCENPPTALHVHSYPVARAFLEKIQRDAPDWSERLALSTVITNNHRKAYDLSGFSSVIVLDLGERSRMGVEMLSRKISGQEGSVQQVSVPVSFRILYKVTVE